MREISEILGSLLIVYLFYRNACKSSELQSLQSIYRDLYKEAQTMRARLRDKKETIVE